MNALVRVYSLINHLIKCISYIVHMPITVLIKSHAFQATAGFVNIVDSRGFQEVIGQTSQVTCWVFRSVGGPCEDGRLTPDRVLYWVLSPQ